ncbi:MAG: hypothetical protein ACFB9M_00395 [Myxococcota bacterium]
MIWTLAAARVRISDRGPHFVGRDRPCVAVSSDAPLITPDGGVLNSEIVPRGLDALADHLRAFAFEWDTQREQKLRSTHAEVLRKFVDDVNPFVDPIEEWFGSFPGEQPEEAWAFMYLLKAQDEAIAFLDPPAEPQAEEAGRDDWNRRDEELDAAIERLSSAFGDGI